SAAAQPLRGGRPATWASSGDAGLEWRGAKQILKVGESHRWAAVWILMASTGMRRGEVLGLRWTDVDLKGSTVTIRSTRICYGKAAAPSTPKTARRNRTPPIGPATLSPLRGWKRTQTAERLQIGGGWQETGLVVTKIAGTARNP